VRVSIIVSDDNGNSYQGDAELTQTASAKQASKVPKKASTLRGRSGLSVNFSSPIRAFVKRHATDMAGSQKFALLVAYLTKGDTHKEVLLVDVQRQWNRMKPLLAGKFNLAYPIRAKESEWVDSPRRGVYVILPGWKGIFDA